MDKIIRGNKISYWKNNAKDNYDTTPISVLKYITILEEALDDSNNMTSSQRIIESFEALGKAIEYTALENKGKLSLINRYEELGKALGIENSL